MLILYYTTNKCMYTIAYIDKCKFIWKWAIVNVPSTGFTINKHFADVQGARSWQQMHLMVLIFQVFIYYFSKRQLVVLFACSKFDLKIFILKKIESKVYFTAERFVVELIRNRWTNKYKLPENILNFKNIWNRFN